jgi:hypothetical protein
MKLLNPLLAALVIASMVCASAFAAKLDSHGVNERPKKVPVAYIDRDAPDPTNTGDDQGPSDDGNTGEVGGPGTTTVGPGGIDAEPDVPCTADLTGDGYVDVLDVVAVFENWGPCDGTCAADSNGDQIVDVMDLIDVVSAWGSCIP